MGMAGGEGAAQGSTWRWAAFGSGVAGLRGRLAAQEVRLLQNRGFGSS